MNPGKAKWMALAALFVFLAASALHLHPFGRPVPTLMDDYMLNNAQAETDSNNVVASVLFDYRGLDTLGEATVLFSAAMGVFLVFRRVKDAK